MRFWKKKRKTVELAREPVISDCPERIALFGDIHANLEALEAVLADARAQGVSRFVCTGDIVGYAANPSECLKIVRDLNCPVVMGNHDFYAATDASLKDFTLNAMNAVLWTREQLSEEESAWIRGLPLQRECRISNVEQRMKKDDELKPSSFDIPCSMFCGSHRLVHASLEEPMRWHYILKPEKALPALQVQKEEMVFFGHTHVPTLYSYNPETEEFKESFPLGEGTHELAAGWKHLINPGSVGQPRDRDTRASYAIFDSKTGTVEFRRVEYDFAVTQKKIEAADLPFRNSERLSLGR